MKKDIKDNNQKDVATKDNNKNVTNLQQEIEKLKTENGQLLTGWQRTQADFENFRNRSMQEKAQLISAANTELIGEIIPVLDNFERALNHKPKELVDNEYLKGLEYIKIQLEQILNNYNLSKISVKIGDQFDPAQHEAIAAEENPKFKSDQITEIVQNGYKIGDKVLRPVQVKVAK